MARDNKTIGKFKLKGIRKAPAGVPQIEVTFDIDANGILMVSAKDLDTGKAQSITITADDRMSDSEIEQAIRDAQQYAGQDSLRRDALSLHSEAQTLYSQAQQALKNGGKEIEKEEKKQIKKDSKALEKLLMKFRVDKVTEEQLNEIQSAKQQLESSSARVREMYGGK
jgi:molecular chaperone DnaK